MGVGYDCASSLLLCPEDNTSILGFEEEEEQEKKGEVVGACVISGCTGGGARDARLPEFPFMGFPLQSEDCLALLVVKESDHLPRGDYAERLQTGALDGSIRREAIDWIGKVHAHYNFGPLSAYLAVNYLDRFLSYYDLPKGKTWMTQLLSVSCLSLAAKMEETEVPLSLDLQIGDAKYIFEAKTIQRMELLVLSTLKWRMQAVTPFSYIDYFVEKFNGGLSLPRLSLSRSVDLILNTIRRIDLLEFKPSEIAASVAFAVSGGAQALDDVNEALSSCIHIDRERAFRCYEVIRDMTLINRPFKGASGSVSSVPQSPNGVLDACLSYKSDGTTVGSQANSHCNSPVAKRRKLNCLPSS